jgi:hypothetical protein
MDDLSDRLRPGTPIPVRDELKEETMRKLCALLIAGLLAGPTLVDPAFPQPRWQYGWWQLGLPLAVAGSYSGAAFGKWLQI